MAKDGSDHGPHVHAPNSEAFREEVCTLSPGKAATVLKSMQPQGASDRVPAIQLGTDGTINIPGQFVPGFVGAGGKAHRNIFILGGPGNGKQITIKDENDNRTIVNCGSKEDLDALLQQFGIDLHSGKDATVPHAAPWEMGPAKGEVDVEFPDQKHLRVTTKSGQTPHVTELPPGGDWKESPDGGIDFTRGDISLHITQGAGVTSQSDMSHVTINITVAPDVEPRASQHTEGGQVPSSAGTGVPAIDVSRTPVSTASAPAEKHKPPTEFIRNITSNHPKDAQLLRSIHDGLSDAGYTTLENHVRSRYNDGKEVPDAVRETSNMVGLLSKEDSDSLKRILNTRTKTE